TQHAELERAVAADRRPPRIAPQNERTRRATVEARAERPGLARGTSRHTPQPLDRDVAMAARGREEVAESVRELVRRHAPSIRRRFARTQGHWIATLIRAWQNRATQRTPSEGDRHATRRWKSRHRHRLGPRHRPRDRRAPRTARRARRGERLEGGRR